MAMIVAISVFGSALTVAIWTIWSTVAADMPRIVDLLRHGPQSTALPPQPVLARTTTRDVRVRSIRQEPAPLRAAA